MSFNRPYFVASETSGVDGGSEGGRLSTTRLPATLVLYSVPLLQSLKRAGYEGKLNAEAALVDGSWVIKVIYEGEQPPDVPTTWQGHRVVVEEVRPADG
jgi:hypothetical protein